MGWCWEKLKEDRWSPSDMPVRNLRRLDFGLHHARSLADGNCGLPAKPLHCTGGYSRSIFERTLEKVRI